VITRYEVVPAPGVRVEKIAGLDKNIALGMRAQSVRILAPIPGKAAVGVEVPNQRPTPVGLREILESEDWASAKAELPIALGQGRLGQAPDLGPGEDAPPADRRRHRLRASRSASTRSSPRSSTRRARRTCG
jgi:hypothetical protein